MLDVGGFGVPIAVSKKLNLSTWLVCIYDAEAGVNPISKKKKKRLLGNLY
jgi:hypothetical protein